MNVETDCVIIGGGPAGATAGTILADYGHRVLILERAQFPRHHVGESLMPETYWTFRRIGMLEKLQASDFPRKQSVQFVSASGKESLPYYFTDRDPGEHSITWQVRRDKFDRMMLDNAREHGADVREGANVNRVLFDGERAVGVTATLEGKPVEIAAKVVIDATGQNTLLSRQLGLRKPEARLKKAAIYAHFRGARRETGRDAGATIILHTRDGDGWFWYLPLPDDVASIGLVGDPVRLFSDRSEEPLDTLMREIESCETVGGRVRGAERITPAHVIRDFSYRADRLAGHGWVLIGDAFGFLDPIYSSGVMLALKSAEFAADAIHDGLTTGDLSATQLGRFGDELTAGMQRLRQLVYAFYDKNFSFGRFLGKHPEFKDHLVRLLIGDVFSEDVGAIFEPMSREVEFPERIPLASV